MAKVKKEKKAEDLVHISSVDLSGVDNNFYGVDKEPFLKRKPLYRRLSSGFIDYPRIKDEKDFLKKSVEYLTRTAYSLFRVMTNETDPVLALTLNSELSFCGLDKNFIQIGLSLLTLNNISDEMKNDILTGIISHEFYHKRFTARDIRQTVIGKRKYEPFYGNEKVVKYIKDTFPTQLHLTLHNIIEDRRIERLGVEEFPGYVFFFDELRKFAYFLHSKKNFHPTFPSGIILDFILIKILLPELEKGYLEQFENYKTEIRGAKIKVSSAGILKMKISIDQVEECIKKINQYIDLNKSLVLSDSYSDTIEVTNYIYSLIPKELQEEMEAALGAQKIKYVNVTEGFATENENEGLTKTLSDKMIEELEKAMSDELDKMDQEAEDSVNEKLKEPKIQNEKITSKDNLFNYSQYQIIEEPLQAIDNNLFNQARKISKNIVNKLGFLDSRYSRLVENYEMTEGELDEDELFSISIGNKHLFQDIESLPSYALDFGILLDESGSMSGRIKEAKLAVLALLLGLKDNEHVNLFVYGHTANHGPDTYDKVQIYKYFNTIERFTNWKTIFSAKSRSNNADGYAIERVAEFMKQSKAREKILCVVSDGQPSASHYGGVSGENHVKQVVSNLERQGITVIQICMNFIENSPRMFKHYIPYDSDGKFFENLKKVLMTKLQQFGDSV